MNPIITASLTGPAATSKDTPAMPRTPEEIAESAKGAYEAGAAVLHIHLRDNDNFTADLEGFKEIDHQRDRPDSPDIGRNLVPNRAVSTCYGAKQPAVFINQ